MKHRGFSHIGLSTLDLDKTRAFYEGVLGFKPVVGDTITIEEGGHLRHMFFDVGGGQLIAFLERNGVSGVPAKYDAGINRGLGVPAGFYHFAFEAGSPVALTKKRDELRGKGVKTTDIVDHGWARSIYFKDPNGISLEYCCVVGNRPEGDAMMQGRFTVSRAALELTDALSKARSTGDRPKWEVDDDQDRALLLRLAARGGDRRACVCGGVSLPGVPTPYWLAVWRQHLFRERAGAHRGAEQGLCARQRRGAKDRNSFLPRLRLLGILVR